MVDKIEMATQDEGPRKRFTMAQMEEQKRLALQMKIQGKSYRHIAETFGVSVATACARVKAAMEEQPSPDVETFRKLEDSQLDRLTEEMMSILDNPATNSETRMKAVDRLVRLQERRAKLHGLDAPTRADVTITEQTETERELAELFAAQDAKNRAAREAIESPLSGAEPSW